MSIRKATTWLLGTGAWLLLLGSPDAARGQAEDWRAIEHPPLRPFEPQQPLRIELDNGMVIFLQEDHELPLVAGFARIRGGSREEPADKVGLVGLYGQAWRTSGTAQRDGDALDDFLEARAASVETAGGGDSTRVSFDCLKENLDEVFPVFVELLRRPDFKEDKLVLAKQQLFTGIARRNDDPQGIAAREAVKLGYGASSPYARHSEYASVAAVGLADLRDWHAKTVHPNNVILGVTGDFDPAAMEALLRGAFGSWPRGPAAPRLEDGAPSPRQGVFFVQRDDVNQSNIRILHLGTVRNAPDRHALEVMNEIFGGGMSARLFSNIRSKKGLAYSVGGGVGSAWDHRGLFQVVMGTKSESTAAAIEALFEEIDALKAAPPSPEELARAKDAILNSFVFRFDSGQKVLAEQMLYEFYGYPADFLAGYQEAIQAVNPEQVLAAARKYIHRDELAILVVGKSQDFDAPLGGFGEVTPLDITIPPPPDAPPAPSPEAD